MKLYIDKEELNERIRLNFEHLSNPNYAINKAYVLSNSNIRKEDRIIYLPVYLAMYIKDRASIGILPTL